MSELPQPDAPLSMPQEILRRAKAINLYYMAVGAISLVVVFVPLLAMSGALPDQLWAGWNLCIGGLIALMGAQSKQ
jgi:hypothetical protein